MLLVTGALQWQGVPNSGAKGGKITFFKPEHVPDLAPTSEPLSDDLSAKIKAVLARGGAFFFKDILAQCETFGPGLLEPCGHWCGMAKFPMIHSHRFGVYTAKKPSPSAGYAVPDGVVFSDRASSIYPALKVDGG